jgi:HAD superfamily hydrolase (TIGR01509 family)
MTDRIRAVVFDLDGVLVDTEPWWFEARVAVAVGAGGRWTAQDEAAVKGANSREWAAAMAARLGPAGAAHRFERAVVAEVLARYRRGPVPTIEAGLRAVRRMSDRGPLALASSAHTEVIDAALVALGIRERFSAVVSSDAVGAGKPAPDVYLEAARRLDVPPPGCLVIEDSLAGVQAARAAEMRVVLVPAAGHAPGPGADALATMVLDSLDSLDDERMAVLEAVDPVRRP